MQSLYRPNKKIFPWSLISLFFSLFIPNLKTKKTEEIGTRERETRQINTDSARGFGEGTVNFFHCKFKSLGLFIYNPGE